MSSSESFINKYLIFFLLILIGTVTASYFLKRLLLFFMISFMFPHFIFIIFFRTPRKRNIQI